MSVAVTGTDAAPPPTGGARWAMGPVPFLPGMVGYLAVMGSLVFWGHSGGVVLGSPVVLTALFAAVLAGSHERWQRFLGSGRMDNRLILRLTLANGHAAAIAAVSGWSILMPPWAIVIAAVHIGWSGSRSWRPAAVLTTIASLATQAAVHAGLVRSIMPVLQSDFAVVAGLLLALTALNNIGVSAARSEVATRELHRAEARFRALVQRSSDLVTVLDAYGQVTLVSPAVSHLTGWEQADMLDRDGFRLVHADDQPAARSAFAELVTAAEGTEKRLEVRWRQRDGSWRWHEVTMCNLLADPAVQGIVCNGRDVSERRLDRDRLAHAAAHDGLTGLPNRSETERRLTAALRTVRPGQYVAMLYIDLDGFKDVNDTYGHVVGDGLLVAVTQRLQTALRPSDVLGRLGGDEFAVILRGMPAAGEVHALVSALTAAMAEPFVVSGQIVSVGASIGVAIADSDSADPHGLVSQADAAMYAVKRANKALR